VVGNDTRLSGTLDPAAVVSIIIVHYNAVVSLENCLQSMAEFCCRPGIEIIIIDNASPDRSWRQVVSGEWHKGQYAAGECSLVVKELERNLGFAAAANIGATSASGEYLFFLNPDIVCLESPFPALLDFYRKTEKCGTLGPRLLYPDGRLQPSRGSFPHLLSTFSHIFRLKKFLPADEKMVPFVGPLLGSIFAQWKRADQTQQVDYTTGAALLISRDLFARFGGFDEQFFLYFEEIDLCYRLDRAGYTNYFLPCVTMVHEVGSSHEETYGFKERVYIRSLLAYYRKHKSAVQTGLIRMLLKLSFRARSLVLLLKSQRKKAVADELAVAKEHLAGLRAMLDQS